MSRWISQNLSLFLLSLLLAFFFWAVATEAEDPTQVSTFPTPVPVEVRGLGEDVTAYGADNVRVRVEVRAPQSVWGNLRGEDIEAYIDLTDVETGTVEVPVHVELDAGPASVTGVTPQNIELTVERIADKEVPVRTEIEGSTALGYMAREPEIAPQTVRVRGPESQTRQVTAVLIEASIGGRQSDLREDFVPTPIDENGEPVTQVEVIPESVTVFISITQWLNTRDVPVSPNLVGQPAPGYRVSNVILDPQVVTVWGRAELLASTTTLQTEQISLEGITQTLETTVSLQIPNGLQLLNARPVVTVTLPVEAIRSGLTLEITPTTRGLDPALIATVNMDAVIVILSGPLSTMETLDPEDVEIVLDLTDLRPGEYNLEPEVEVPAEVDVERIIPEEVPVEIEARPQTDEIFE